MYLRCLPWLNEEQVPPDEPVFGNRALADEAKTAFDTLTWDTGQDEDPAPHPFSFVQAIHEATLRRR
jgi:hypothetical protein